MIPPCVKHWEVRHDDPTRCKASTPNASISTCYCSRREIPWTNIDIKTTDIMVLKRRGFLEPNRSSEPALKATIIATYPLFGQETRSHRRKSATCVWVMVLSHYGFIIKPWLMLHSWGQLLYVSVAEITFLTAGQFLTSWSCDPKILLQSKM